MYAIVPERVKIHWIDPKAKDRPLHNFVHNRKSLERGSDSKRFLCMTSLPKVRKQQQVYNGRFLAFLF